MKVSTDACIFGAWCAEEIESENQEGKKLLDVGGGTGLLSLMISQKAPLNIDTVEIDAQAATQAKENVHAAKAPNITVHNSDILDFEPTHYNYIVSNPPFYEADLASPSTRRSVAHHGNSLCWNDLFRIVSDKLLSDGSFYLLLPYKRASEMEALLKTYSLFIEKKIAIRHSAQHAPSRLLIKGKKKYCSTTEDELTIMGGENYTSKFINLLKDYYLTL